MLQGETATGQVASAAGRVLHRPVHDPTMVTELYRALVNLSMYWNHPQSLALSIQRSGVPIDTSHFTLLSRLEQLGPVMLRDLAEATLMSPSNASKIVDQFEARGWAERRVPPSDRRVTLIELTDEGRKVHAKLEDTGAEILNEELSILSTDETELLCSILTRLAADAGNFRAELLARLQDDERSDGTLG